MITVANGTWTLSIKPSKRFGLTADLKEARLHCPDIIIRLNRLLL